MADDGDLEPGPFIGEFVNAIRSLSPETIAANLRSRSLVDYPQGLGVPDIAVFLDLCAGTGDCPWSAGAPAPAVLAAHVTAVHGGKIYVFGGADPRGACCSDAAYAYDPAANEWATKRPMPQMSAFNGAHSIGDTIYVVAGSAIRPDNKLYAYNPITDEWSPRAARPLYRSRFASAVVNDRLYVIGGTGPIGNDPMLLPTEIMSEVEVYDPATDRWSTAAPLPMALTQSRACVFDDQIYVFGGANVSSYQPSILTYNTTSNSWSAKSPMPITRYAFDCATTEDAVYIIGGFAYAPGGGLLDPVDRYDPFVETWSSPTRIQTPRHGLAAAVVGTRIFTIGGHARPAIAGQGDRAVDVVEILDTEQL